MPLRRVIVLCVLLGLIGFGVIWGLLAGRISKKDIASRQQSEKPPVLIIKQPAAFANHTFDPAAPPADMPPLGLGENAECESNFVSSASVAGESRKQDATHSTLTITHVKVTLQLNINIWVPMEVTQHVIEHEEGHRQISEYYYQDADKIAERIAETYVGKQVEITGTDLHEESSKMLQQMAADITDEYDKQLNPGPTQLLYDNITDHSRNEIVAQDAVVAAIKNEVINSIQSATNPGN